MALKRLHGPTERVEWDPSVISYREAGARHKSWNGFESKAAWCPAFIDTPLCVRPAELSQRNTVRNYARYGGSAVLLAADKGRHAGRLFN